MDLPDSLMTARKNAKDSGEKVVHPPETQDGRLDHDALPVLERVVKAPDVHVDGVQGFFPFQVVVLVWFALMHLNVRDLKQGDVDGAGIAD